MQKINDSNAAKYLEIQTYLDRKNEEENVKARDFEDYKSILKQKNQEQEEVKFFIH